MNFSHRCACVLSFILGIILSMILNQLIDTKQFTSPIVSSNCDVLQSFANLEERVNKLFVNSEQSSLQDHSGKQIKIFSTTAIANNSVDKVSSTRKSGKYLETSTSNFQVEQSMKTIRLLCWILTGPKNHKKKAIHVKNTWGKRCDKLLFVSTQSDESLPTTVIKGMKEGRNGLWSKTKAAFKLIYEKYLEETDFVLKADDDTYVIIENLKYLLKDYNSSVPNYFGCHFKLPLKKQNTTAHWHSGGAGYVLSKGAVKLLVEKGYKSSKCKRSLEGGPEDMNIARCLEVTNVSLVDTRDALGRHTFHAYPAKLHLTPGALPKWWWQYIQYPQKSGMECCSEHAISFHYIGPNDMYMYEYMLYHLRPYGVQK